MKVTKKDAKAGILTLQQALKILGPKGEHWIKRSYHNAAETKFCALGAIHKANGLGEYIAGEALENTVPDFDVPTYNDSSSRKFPEIRKKFLEAIKLLEDGLV